MKLVAVLLAGIAEKLQLPAAQLIWRYSKAEEQGEDPSQAVEALVGRELLARRLKELQPR